MASRLAAIREVVLGGERRLGLWILPLFLVTALLAATVVGGLAVLYYGQQVRGLASTTSAARERLDTAARRVDADTKQARADINRQVREAREELSQRPPVTDPNQAGVYAVSATHPDQEVRVGSAFTVFSNPEETYLITTYSMVVLETGRGTVTAAQVFLPGQAATARVHTVDLERDLALLVVDGGPFPVSQWRAAATELRISDAAYVVGVAGTDTPAVLSARIAGFSATAVLHDAPMNRFLAGGPLVDAEGKVIAMTSMDYAPFGVVDGDLRYAVPVREICVLVLDCTAEDLEGG